MTTNPSGDLAGLVDPHEYRRKVFAWAEAQGFTRFRLSIYQPKLADADDPDSAASEWKCTLDDLEAFAEHLHLKVDRARLAEKEHARLPLQQWWPIYLNPEPNETECAFCRASPICPSQQAKLQKAAGADFSAIAEAGAVHVPTPRPTATSRSTRR